MNGSRIVFGIVLALLVVGVVAGVGWYAYNVGIAQGMAASGNLVPSAPGSVAPTAPYYAPYWYVRPFGFGFGILACLAPLLFLFLLMALFRLMFWRGHRSGGPWMHRHGGWDPERGEMPDKIREWHRKLHEQEGTPPPPSPASS